jgi:hypothetical protein
MILHAVSRRMMMMSVDWNVLLYADNRPPRRIEDTCLSFSSESSTEKRTTGKIRLYFFIFVWFFNDFFRIFSQYNRQYRLLTDIEYDHM